ncbi:MAG: hypothetical protein XD87_0190 [candidate division WS6 bacterium 36_33]|uniref:Uncharacterized protein n=1 Tax=candidate division WS6 bacterium 36_33 TaxID=1641388 RepID=A0A101GZH1_9BACT|nr:MAG: hypothetical protein XD87_0190 [candidate division WS6 bacterium 36_33]
MKERITELGTDRVSSPTDLIDDYMEFSVWSMEGKPSAWYSVVCLLDEVEKVNSNWTKEEHNSVKRFLKGFVEETMVVEELPHHQKITVNWLASNGGEDVGQPTGEEMRLINKWVGKFRAVNIEKN